VSFEAAHDLEPGCTALVIKVNTNRPTVTVGKCLGLQPGFERLGEFWETPGRLWEISKSFRTFQGEMLPAKNLMRIDDPEIAKSLHDETKAKDFETI
jgi:hypothetical protein